MDEAGRGVVCGENGTAQAAPAQARAYVEGRGLLVRQRAVVDRHEQRPGVVRPHLLRGHQQLARRRPPLPVAAAAAAWGRLVVLSSFFWGG